MHFSSLSYLSAAKRGSGKRFFFIDASHANTSCSNVAVHCNGSVSNVLHALVALAPLADRTKHHAYYCCTVHSLGVPLLPFQDLYARFFMRLGINSVGGISGGVVNLLTQRRYRFIAPLLGSGATFLAVWTVSLFDAMTVLGRNCAEASGYSSVILLLPFATNNCEAGTTGITGECVVLQEL